MARRERLTVPRVEDALTRSHGVASHAALLLRCAPRSVFRMLEKHERLRVVRGEAERTVTDIAEATVVKAIAAGDLAAAQWWLARRDPTRFGTRLDAAVGIAPPPVVTISLNFAPAPQVEERPGLRLVEAEPAEVVELRPALPPKD